MRFPIRFVAAAVAVFLICALSQGFAQTYQAWRGENTQANLLDPNAWWNFPNNSTMVFGQQEFDNNVQTSNNLNNGGNTFSTWRWVFKGGASSTRTFTGDGIRFFDFNGQDGGIYNESSATHVLNIAVNGDGDAADPFQIHLNSTGGLTFGSTVNNQGGTIEILGTASGSKTVTFTGVVSGTGGMYVNNANAIVLFDAANTMSGQLTINAGTVRLGGSGDTFGASSQAVRIGTGASLDLNGVSTTVGSVGEEGASDGGTISLGSGTLTINGSATGLNQNSISGTGGLTFSGSGGLSLYGTQNYTGTTTVTGGTLSTASAMSSAAYSLTGGTFRTTAANLISDTASMTLGGGTLSIGGTETFGNNGVTLSTSTTSTVAVDGGNTGTVSGIVSGAGNLVKTNTGQFNLSGNNTYTGTTTVGAGSLEAQSANALGNTSAGTTVGSGAELRLWNSGGVTYAAEGLTLNGAGINSGGALRNITNNNVWQGNITYGSGARINSDNGTLTISGTLAGGANNMYFGGSGNVTLSNTVAGTQTTGDGAIFKDGTGTLTLSANNSGLTGLFRIRGGTVSITNANSLGTGSLELGNSTTTAPLS